MCLKFLILSLLNCWIILATISNHNDTSSTSKQGVKNNIKSLDGPLKRLVETGTIQVPCVNRTITETKNLKDAVPPIPIVPIASHRNFYRTVKEPAYYPNFFEQNENQQPQQKPQPQQQQSEFDYELSKHPFFYYYFTTKQAQETVKTEATTTPISLQSTTIAASHSAQNSQVQYEPKLRFVFGMPMSTLENYHPGIKPYFNRLQQIDPHAYFPKQLRPKYMTVTAPYQPLYHVIRAVVVPDELLEGQQAQQQSTVEKLNAF